MRKSLSAFSSFLALLGLWLLVPQLLPAGGEGAAQIAMVRADLWADNVYAIDHRANIAAISRQGELSGDAKSISRACKNALGLAPIASRLWAVCAPYCPAATSSECASHFLEMSYFTGPYAADAISKRLRVASTLDFDSNPEIRRFVAEDIRLILRQNPALKPELAAAFREAAPNNKKFLLDEFNENDPTFASTLR